jgi:hypothetical protein
MPTLDSSSLLSDRVTLQHCLVARMKWLRTLLPLTMGVISLLNGGCSKEPGLESIETDANGYQCLKCGAKLYTARKVFLEDCPKCKQDGLVEVVAFRCPKDDHLTLRPKVSGPEGAAVCEQCNAQLKSALVSPRTADLKNWGAKETGP